MAIPTSFLRLLFAITKYLTRSLYRYWRPLLATWISCMSAISLYQAFIPTSSHNVGLIVDPGAEIIQEVVGLVDVSNLSFPSLPVPHRSRFASPSTSASPSTLPLISLYLPLPSPSHFSSTPAKLTKILVLLPKPHPYPPNPPLHLHLHNPLDPFHPHNLQNLVYTLYTCVLGVMDLRNLLG
jgi:hypothetical protein